MPLTDADTLEALSFGFVTPPNDAEIKLSAMRQRHLQDVPVTGWDRRLAQSCTETSHVTRVVRRDGSKAFVRVPC